MRQWQGGPFDAQFGITYGGATDTVVGWQHGADGEMHAVMGDFTMDANGEWHTSNEHLLGEGELADIGTTLGTAAGAVATFVSSLVGGMGAVGDGRAGPGLERWVRSRRRQGGARATLAARCYGGVGARIQPGSKRSHLEGPHDASARRELRDCQRAHPDRLACTHARQRPSHSRSIGARGERDPGDSADLGREGPVAGGTVLVGCAVHLRRVALMGPRRAARASVGCIQRVTRSTLATPVIESSHDWGTLMTDDERIVADALREWLEIRLPRHCARARRHDDVDQASAEQDAGGSSMLHDSPLVLPFAGQGLRPSSCTRDHPLPPVRRRGTGAPAQAVARRALRTMRPTTSRPMPRLRLAAS